MQKTVSATPLETVKVEQRPDGQADVWLRRNITEQQAEGADGEGTSQWVADEVHIVRAVTQAEAEAAFDALWDEAQAAEAPQGERVAALEQVAKAFTESVASLSQIRTAAQLSVRAIAATLDDAQAAGVSTLLRPWGVGEEFAQGEPFTHGGRTWRASQAFTGQARYEPGGAGFESLFYEVRVAPDGVPVWKEPTGGHDCPNLGDRRHYPDEDGPVYVSKRDGNTSEPTEDQWWEAEGE